MVLLDDPKPRKSNLRGTRYIGSMVQERTGRSRALRRILKAKREDRGWSLQKAANKIAEDIERAKLSGEAVRQWENFETHPSIDKFASWARVLGMQLVVDLVEVNSSREIALLAPRTIDLARAFEMAAPDDQEIIATMMERLGLMR